MKSIAAFLAVNAFFVALNVLGAGILFVLFRLGQVFTPGLMDQPLFVLPLGLLGLAATIWCARWFMAWLSRGPARGRA